MKIGILVVLAVLALVSVVSADLPSSIHGYVTYNGAVWSIPTFMDIDVVPPTGNDDLPNANNYIGWCVDEPTPIYVPYDGTFEVFSSRNLGSYPGYTVEWDKVNYILNNKGNAKWPAIQAAIWHYSNSKYGKGYIPDGWFSPGGSQYGGTQYYVGIQEEYNALVADAEANGAGFNPICGQKYAVILYVSGSVQTIFLEGTLPPCTNAPEFPTLALPVAMMIGVVGVVHVIKGREK